MTPETKQALDLAVKAAGTQLELCRRINRPQSSFWTWQKGAGPTPAAVPELVAITGGDVTADRFRRDAFGWLAPINRYLRAQLPAETALAAIDLTWHQVSRDNAEAHLVGRGWTVRRARKALRTLDSYRQTGEAAA